MTTKTPQQVKATNIGNIAFAALSIDQEGFVLGKTSKGIFIKTSGKYLIFIATLKFRGPLTINLPETVISFGQIPHLSPVHLSSRILRFPEAGLEISTQRSIVWGSPVPDSPPLLASVRKERLRESASKIMRNNNIGGISSLLPNVLNDPDSHHPNSSAQSTLDKGIILLHERLQRTAKLPAPSAITSLLGAGSGLTPSGDDFIIGLLLSLNRWADTLVPGQDLQELNEQVVEAAYQKTSLLSANLIECATRGQADERLINALDWLMSNTKQPSSCLDDLLNWGSSSGGDVFLGFTVSLSLQTDII
jgi:hypothetical protein